MTSMLDDAGPEALREYLERLEMNLQAVRRRLKRFEDEHGLSTAEFYPKLQAGEMKGLDYAEWAGEYETALRLEKQRDEVKKKLKDEG
jgi:predicted nuclease with TOPRIM domain